MDLVVVSILTLSRHSPNEIIFLYFKQLVSWINATNKTTLTALLFYCLISKNIHNIKNVSLIKRKAKHLENTCRAVSFSEHFQIYFLILFTAISTTAFRSILPSEYSILTKNNNNDEHYQKVHSKQLLIIATKYQVTKRWNISVVLTSWVHGIIPVSINQFLLCFQ